MRRPAIRLRTAGRRLPDDGRYSPSASHSRQHCFSISSGYWPCKVEVLTVRTSIGAPRLQRLPVLRQGEKLAVMSLTVLRTTGTVLMLSAICTLLAPGLLQVIEELANELDKRLHLAQEGESFVDVGHFDCLSVVNPTMKFLPLVTLDRLDQL